MSYEIRYTSVFRRELKRLGKKYPSLRTDFGVLLDQLAQDPVVGTPIGKRCFKIRLAIKSKGAGKSGGARVITCVVHVRKEVRLLTIYDKSEQGTITARELQVLLDEMPPEK